MPSSDSSLHLRSRKTLLLLVVTLASVLLRVLLPSAFLERIYSRGVFIAVRHAIDHTLGWIPFPLFFLFWIVVIAAAIAEVMRWRSRAGRGGGVRYALLGIVNAALLLITLFLWLWGFNYGREAVETQLDFATYEPTLDELRTRVYASGANLSTLRDSITADTSALTAADLPAGLEAAIRPLVGAALRRHGYPAPGRPRGWRLLPKGILLRLGTAGVYWPWAAQGNIDGGLHPLQQPAVLAHELAHAYGFGDEGTCSFWAYLAGAESGSPVLRYAFELAYWRQIAGRLRYADPEGYLAWRKTELAPGIKQDLAAIYTTGELYQDIAPAIRDATYTAYLHAQGIDDGLLNYGRVVRLVEGYRRNYR